MTQTQPETRLEGLLVLSAFGTPPRAGESGHTCVLLARQPSPEAKRAKRK